MTAGRTPEWADRAGLNWISAADAASAESERAALLRSMNGKARFTALRNKAYLGELSPGCRLCASGHWSCLFINRLCTASCFYCPQDRRPRKEAQPRTENVDFQAPEGYIEYLGKFGHRGTGISGGEPLLVFGRTLDYISGIRKRFGKKFYIWLYTNGDLVDDWKLVKLKEAGLDELRFDLSARGYDLGRVALAARRLDTVTVEIPAIPEDQATLERLLPGLGKIGVKYLNLHQLMATPENHRALAERGYTFLRYPAVSVLESEMAALRIMQSAARRDPGLSVNYCSSTYKCRIQDRGNRVRRALTIKEGREELTQNGYLRSLSLQGPPGMIRRTAEAFKAQGRDEGLWAMNTEGTELDLHWSLAKDLPRGSRFALRYFDTRISTGAGSADRAFPVERVLAAERTGLDRRSLDVFLKALSAGDARGAVKYLMLNYDLKTSRDISDLKRDSGTVKTFAGLERVERGFPGFY